MFTTFLIKVNDVNDLKSNLKNPKFEFSKRGVNLNYNLSNRYNGADLMFLFKEGLYLIIRILSKNFHTKIFKRWLMFTM